MGGDHLAFLNHVHQLDATQSAAGRVEGFEAEHRPDDPFYGPVILLDEIVQVFDLADFDGLAGFLLECLKSGGVCPALVDRDFLRKTVLTNESMQNRGRLGCLFKVFRAGRSKGGMPLSKCLLQFSVEYLGPHLQE